MYLIKNDYISKIQVVNLNQVIQNSDEILAKCELIAQEEAVAHLVQKYDVDKEFTDTSEWSITLPYYVGNRVYLDADAYVSTNNYVLNSLTIYNGSVYRCTASTTGTFDASKWTLLGDRYEIYYVKAPNPLFNLYNYYRVGDVVYYKDRNYTCKIETTIIGHNGSLQYQSYENLPLSNIFPDDIVNGAKYWTPAGSAYSVTAGTALSDTTKFTKGDNRNQFMLSTMISIVLFYAHQAIAPRNIPQRIIDAYTKSITDLSNASRGEITLRLPLLQPKSGGRIRYGGVVKSINNY